MIGGRDRSGLLVVLLAIGCWTVLSGTPVPVAAQEEVTAVLRGRVLKADAPVSRLVVKLHRVSSESAGEIDSVATSADGGFQFALPYVPDPEVRREVFFASARFSGILYFGAPVAQPADLDSVYTIEVYDTLSVPESGSVLPIQSRNIFAEPVEGGWSVTDLFEIRNDGVRTLVGRPGGAVWTYPLPRGAENVELGDGDLSADAFGVADGAVRVFAPVPPGTRMFVFRYQVPDLTGGFPLPGTTDRIELLIREPAPLFVVDGLTALAPVEIEPGAAFRRFAGDNVSEGFVRFTAAEEPISIPFGWLVVTVALALATIGLWATRRPLPASRAEILIQVAKLDEAWESSESPSERDRRRYERRRQRLLARFQPGT